MKESKFIELLAKTTFYHNGFAKSLKVFVFNLQKYNGLLEYSMQWGTLDFNRNAKVLCNTKGVTFYQVFSKNLTSLIKQPNTIYLQIKKLSIANITRGIKTDTRKRDKLT